MPVRVVLAEDDYLVREGVQHLLEREPDVEVVADYSDAASLLANVARDEPDVVVTDVRMAPRWEDEGLALAGELRDSAPGVAVVVLSQVASADYAGRIFAGGAGRRAYVLKQHVADRGHLVRIIREVAAGGSYVDPEIVVSLVSRRGASPSPLDDLSPREREVLALMAEGLSNGAIAERLVLTKRSVEGHINAIFLKLPLPDELQVNRRVAAVLLFLAETASPTGPEPLDVSNPGREARMLPPTAPERS
jgi:DNA-binding NarL/FixJ family response regulator